MRSIVMSVSACLSVCLYVCSHISKITRPNFTILLYMLPVAAAPFSSDDSSIRCVLPDLRVTSYLRMGYREIAHFSHSFILFARGRQQSTREDIADCSSYCCCCCYFRERLCGRVVGREGEVCYTGLPCFRKEATAPNVCRVIKSGQ